MSSETYPLRHSGIYRNLPTFDPSIKGLRAIVCGATGISGFNTLRSLLDTPDRWSVVYALSRRPLPQNMLDLLTPEQQARIKFVSVDLTRPGKEVAQILRSAGVAAEYAFFYSYMTPNNVASMSPESADALADTNVPLFDHFLQALSLAGIVLKRILLQTGGKNYGMHIGRVRTPLVESDPQPKHLQINFYYEQEKLLCDYCKKNTGTKWNTVRPAGIVGAVGNAAINTFYPFAVYAAVQQEKKEALFFGGDFDSWQMQAVHSTARLTGYLSEWAVLEEKCKDQAFNAHDGAGLSWDRFFGELARWYNVESGLIGPSEDEGKYHVLEMKGGKEAPLGYGPPLTVRRTFSLATWAQDPLNRKAWEALMARSGGTLRANPFDNIDTMFAGDFAYLNFGTLSCNKLRRFGFNGFVDTLESIFESFVENASLGLLPPVQVSCAHPLI